MSQPLFPPVAIISLTPQPFVPQGWQVVFVQHLGSGTYQWLASASITGRTRARALQAARTIAARLSAHVQQHGVYQHPAPSPLLVPFVPAAPLL